MRNHVITAEEVTAERNKRLTAWVAGELGLDDAKRQQLFTEMTLLFQHATDHELAEYLWEKLAVTNKVQNVEMATKIIKRFHDIALGWLANTAEDLRT
jgi:hypothetical protein